MNKRTSDLQEGLVTDGLADTMTRSSEAVARWARALETRAQDATDPQIVEFGGSGPDILDNVESVFEAAVGGDPSMAGMLKGLSSGFLTAISEPITAVTDEYQAGRIKELQTAFLRDNGETLKALDQALRTAKSGMRELAELIDRTSVGSTSSEVEKILNRKATMGDAVLLDIEGALERATNADERAHLESLREEMKEWMAERDARVEAERPEVDELRERSTQLWEQVLGSRRIMSDAAASASPITEVGRAHAGAPLEVIKTTHHRPDAVAHVVSLHDLLLATRVRFTRALTPE